MKYIKSEHITEEKFVSLSKKKKDDKTVVMLLFAISIILMPLFIGFLVLPFAIIRMNKYLKSESRIAVNNYNENIALIEKTEEDLELEGLNINRTTEALIITIIGIIALSLFFIFPVIVFIYIIGWYIYEFLYYKSDSFLTLKESIHIYTEDCNDLNDHIEDLKQAYVDIKKTNYGNADYSDKSRYNYKRPELKNYKKSENIYNCSATVCKNASQQPFKYICKYFNVSSADDSLAKFESVLNDFSAVEEGKELLKNKRDLIVFSLESKIPVLIKKWSRKKLIRKLGFRDIDFSQLYFPKYKFKYISAGGNSSTECNVVLNIENLNSFVNYLAELSKFRKSIKGQRALMTTALREEIKTRDKHTCKKCGVSIREEPNLLLEIDHIIPVSKGGMTSEENLQTLCWKCNRTKGAKTFNNEE